jgi:hypothetical protein
VGSEGLDERLLIAADLMQMDLLEADRIIARFDEKFDRD